MEKISYTEIGKSNIKNGKVVLVFAGNERPELADTYHNIAWHVADKMISDSKKFIIKQKWQEVGKKPNSSLIAVIVDKQTGQEIMLCKPLIHNKMDIDPQCISSENFDKLNLSNKPDYYGYNNVTTAGYGFGDYNSGGIAIRYLKANGLISEDDRITLVSDKEHSSTNSLVDVKYFRDSENNFVKDSIMRNGDSILSAINLGLGNKKVIDTNHNLTKIADTEENITKEVNNKYTDFIKELRALQGSIVPKFKPYYKSNEVREEKSDADKRNSMIESFKKKYKDQGITDIEKMVNNELNRQKKAAKPKKNDVNPTNEKTIDISRTKIDTDSSLNQVLAMMINVENGTKRQELLLKIFDNVLLEYDNIATEGMKKFEEAVKHAKENGQNVVITNPKEDYLVQLAKFSYFLTDYCAEDYSKCFNAKLSQDITMSDFMIKIQDEMADALSKAKNFNSYLPPLEYQKQHLYNRERQIFTPCKDQTWSAALNSIQSFNAKVLDPFEFSNIDIFDKKHYKDQSSLMKLQNEVESQIIKSNGVLFMPNYFNIRDEFKPINGFKKEVDLYNSTPDVIRTYIENLSLMYAIKHQIPIFGICGGHQMICNAAGLNVDKLKIPQNLKGSYSDYMYSPRAQKPVLTWNQHGQGSTVGRGNTKQLDKIGLNKFGIKSTSEEMIIKDLRVNNGQTIISTQYHPEAKMSEVRDRNIFADFVQGKTIIDPESNLYNTIIDNCSRILGICKTNEDLSKKKTNHVNINLSSNKIESLDI